MHKLFISISFMVSLHGASVTPMQYNHDSNLKLNVNGPLVVSIGGPLYIGASEIEKRDAVMVFINGRHRVYVSPDNRQKVEADWPYARWHWRRPWGRPWKRPWGGHWRRPWGWRNHIWSLPYQDVGCYGGFWGGGFRSYWGWGWPIYEPLILPYRGRDEDIYEVYLPNNLRLGRGNILVSIFGVDEHGVIIRDSGDSRILNYIAITRVPDDYRKSTEMPYLILNSPIGNIKEGDRVIIDFYLFNGRLKDDLQIEILVDGKSMGAFDHLGPYLLNDLSKGSHEVAIKLLSKGSGPSSISEQKSSFSIF